MKIRVPSKTVTVCDICKRESLVLTACVVCGKEYCLTCKAIMAGCVHQSDVCRTCGESDLVKAVVERYVKPLITLLKRRDKALSALRCKVVAETIIVDERKESNESSAVSKARTLLAAKPTTHVRLILVRKGDPEDPEQVSYENTVARLLDFACADRKRYTVEYCG